MNLNGVLWWILYFPIHTNEKIFTAQQEIKLPSMFLKTYSSKMYKIPFEKIIEKIEENKRREINNLK